jgi:inner membrane protein involved in colicin E2 resistance
MSETKSLSENGFRADWNISTLKRRSPSWAVIANSSRDADISLLSAVDEGFGALALTEPVRIPSAVMQYERT